MPKLMQPSNTASDPGFQIWVFKNLYCKPKPQQYISNAEIKLAFESRRHSSASASVTQEMKELGVRNS